MCLGFIIIIIIIIIWNFLLFSSFSSCVCFYSSIIFFLFVCFSGLFFFCLFLSFFLFVCFFISLSFSSSFLIEIVDDNQRVV